jgi:hypothetical protein
LAKLTYRFLLKDFSQIKWFLSALKVYVFLIFFLDSVTEVSRFNTTISFLDKNSEVQENVDESHFLFIESLTLHQIITSPRNAILIFTSFCINFSNELFAQ